MKKSVTENLQESEVQIQECLEEICEEIFTGKEQEEACEQNNLLEFEKQIEICNYEKECLMPGNEEERENILISKITQGLTKNAGAPIELSPHNELTLPAERIDSHNKIVYTRSNGLIETKGDMERLPNGNEKLENRMIQKTKLAKDTEIFRDPSNDSFSMSRRWQNVSTGKVKDRANIYLKPDEHENYKSPRMQRKIFNPISWFKKDNLARQEESMDKVQTANQIPCPKFEPYINNTVEIKEEAGTKEQNVEKSELRAETVIQAAAYVKDTAGREVAPEVKLDKGELSEDNLLNTQEIMVSSDPIQAGTVSKDLQESMVNDKNQSEQLNGNSDEKSESKETESFDLGESGKTVEDASDEDEDSFGYEDEYSVGIDLPSAIEAISGNI